MSKNTQRVAVACTNANGEADLAIIDVKVTPEAYDLGEHYDLATEEAKEQGYEAPFVCFDESEQRNINRVAAQLAK